MGLNPTRDRFAMSNKPINPLRHRMIDDMTRDRRHHTRRFCEKVQKAHVRRVQTFAAFLGRSPDRRRADLRRFQTAYCAAADQRGVNQHHRALRFFSP
jgi:integrase/recombinase XerD